MSLNFWCEFLGTTLTTKYENSTKTPHLKKNRK